MTAETDKMHQDQDTLFDSEFDEQRLHINQFRRRWLESAPDNTQQQQMMMLATTTATDHGADSIDHVAHVPYDQMDPMLQRTREQFSRHKLYVRELEQKRHFLESIRTMRIPDLPFGRLYGSNHAALTLDEQQQIREEDVKKVFVSDEDNERLEGMVREKKRELKEWKSRVAGLKDQFDARYQGVLDRLSEARDAEKQYNELMEKCNELNDEYEKAKSGERPAVQKEEAMGEADKENVQPRGQQEQQQQQQQQQEWGHAEGSVSLDANQEGATKQSGQEYHIQNVQVDDRQHLDNVLRMLSSLSGVTVLGIDDMINTRVIRLVINRRYPVDIWCDIRRMPLTHIGNSRQRAAALDQMLDVGHIFIDTVDFKEKSLAAEFDDIIEVAKQNNDLCFLCTELRERLIQMEEKQRER